jgi:hypothetical protein
MCPDSCDLSSLQVDTDLATEAETSEFPSRSARAIDDVNTESISKPEISKFVVRLPAPLLENLKRVSRHHNRSMNTEINILLGQYIEQVKGDLRPSVDEHVKLNSLLLKKISALSAQKIEALMDLLD